MTMFVVIGALLALLTLALLTWPLWRRGSAAIGDATGVAALREQLDQLAALKQSGVLAEAQYGAARETLERRIADASAKTAAPTQAPSSKPLLLGLASFVCTIAVAGYAWLGTPHALDSALVAAAPAGNSGPVTPEQIEAMVEGLTARLKDNPDDADGWAMLGRSHMVLGRHAQAVPALQKAVALRAGDAALLTEYADALAVTNGRNLDGEPSRLLAQALTIDPNYSKALLLSGMHAFQQKDYAKALQQWDKVVQQAPGGELAQQLQGVIAQARERASGAGPSASATAAATTAPTTTTAATGSSVSGTVTLAPALAAKARPDDTVFVFARAAEGPRMPLAILRKQVKDLPLTFTLDDSMAMSPAAKLSSTPRVVVGARVSASGQATPQAGDLQGFSAPVAPGAAGLAIQITDVVATP